MNPGAGAADLERIAPRVAGARGPRLKVLLSVYACEPGRGSEPGVGWHVVVEAARRQEVWAITRANNRAAIETELGRHPLPTLHMVYYDLPRWARWWKRGGRGIRLYYYLWQLAIYGVARGLHREIRFDVTHHVTFVKYWTPSLLAFLPPPMIWGPVGGGETAPPSLQRDGGWQGRFYEGLRSAGRWLGERDPLVRATARRSAIALATTEETAQRLRVIGARRVRTVSQVALSATERAYLAALKPPSSGDPVRFLSLGNLLHLKGFHLGLQAFAAANLPDAEYWLVGDGPYRRRLERLIRRLGIQKQVRLWGFLPRERAMAVLGNCHVLVHPTLHDSGGWACLEAMAAGRPVICLDLGGPGAQVTSDTGIKIAAVDPSQVIKDLARAMRSLALDAAQRTGLGRAGQARVAEQYGREIAGEVFNTLYNAFVDPARRRTAVL